jgi:glycolate oxidase FAD binding subunit
MSRRQQTLMPADVAELARSLAQAHHDQSWVGFPNLKHLKRLLAHVPEDMTVTVEAGMTLADLQAHLAPHGQWVPIDPPQPGSLTIGELLAFDRSGPRRLGYGGIRDHVIGMRVALADGRLIKSGGQVVKNVAGFDLLKLFIGDHGSLGVIVEVTFKLLPRPRASATFDRPCSNLETVNATLEALWHSPLTPVASDLYHFRPDPPLTLRVVLEGMPEDVTWQDAVIRDLGFQPASADDLENRFWQRHSSSVVHSRSVLPSRLTESLADLMSDDFLARAGNGLILTPATLPSISRGPAPELSRRVKEAFDPHHLLPELPT